jgi:hypothetical protein
LKISWNGTCGFFISNFQIPKPHFLYFFKFWYLGMALSLMFRVYANHEINSDRSQKQRSYYA